MDSVLSSLGTLISNIKSLTLPGLVAALGFAILLWPPQPIDVVTDARLNPEYSDWPKTQEKLLDLAGKAFSPVCNTGKVTIFPTPSADAANKESSPKSTPPATTLDAAGERALRQPQSMPENKPIAVANQFDLERIQRQLADCQEKENALIGAEDILTAAENAKIDALRKQRDEIQETYLGYEKSANDILRNEFKGKLEEKEKAISREEAELVKEDHYKRERARRIVELTRLSGDITLRLNEPGRLRPLQKFDDFLASLGSHVVAFLALALGWSLIFDPINRAVFGYAYETKFDDQLDYVRDDRKPIFVYPKTPTTPSKWWLLPTALGFLGVLLLVLFSDPRPDTPDLCTLSAPICSLINKPPQMLLWLVACLAAMLAGLGLAVLLAGRQADKKKKEAETKEKEERAKAAGAASTGDAASQAESAQDTDKPEIRDVALRTRVALFMQKPSDDPKAKKAADEKKGKEDAHLVCLNSLKEGWEKIRQPEYAIGQGLITRDEYKGIRDEYYTQSLISTGLVLPVMLLTFGFEVTPQLGLGGSKWYQLVLWVFLVLMEAALIMVGADRRNKFEVELETRIASQYLKNCEAAKKPADDPTSKPPTVIEIIQAELKKAKIVEKTDYKIEPGDDPAQKP